MMNYEPDAQRFGNGSRQPLSPPLDYAPAEQRRDFVQDLTNAARENPVSAALIGMGVLWMFMGGRSSLLGGAGRIAGGAYGAARGGAEFVGSAAHYAGSAAYDAAGAVGSAARNVVSGVGGAMHDVADHVGTTLSRGAGAISGGFESAGSRAEAGRNAVSDGAARVGSQASGMMSSAYDGLGSAADRARGMMQETGSSLSAAARSAQERGYSMGQTVQRDLADIFERQPLLLGAVGVAIGAALAAAVPATDAENRLMGETSESLKEQAKQMASAQMERAKSMGTDLVQEVSREAGAQGLTAAAASQAFSAIKDKLSSVAESARDGLKNKLEQNGSAGSGRGQQRG